MADEEKLKSIIIPEHLKPKDARFGSGPTKVPQEHVERLVKFLGGGEEPRELTDHEKVVALRALIIVELATALTMERNDYVSGRIGGYEFVLDAINLRWHPEIGDWQEEVEALRQKLVG